MKRQFDNEPDSAQKLFDHRIQEIGTRQGCHVSTLRHLREGPVRVRSSEHVDDLAQGSTGATKGDHEHFRCATAPLRNGFGSSNTNHAAR